MAEITKVDQQQHRVIMHSGFKRAVGSLWHTGRSVSIVTNGAKNYTLDWNIPDQGIRYQLSYLYLSSWPTGAVRARIMKNGSDYVPFFGPGVYYFEYGADNAPSWQYPDVLTYNEVSDFTGQYAFYVRYGYFRFYDV